MMRFQEKIVGIGIALVILLLIAIAFMSFRQTGRANEATSRIDYTRGVLMELNELFNTTIQHAGAARSYSISGSAEDVSKMQSTATELTSKLKDLRSVYRNNQNKQAILDSLSFYIERRVAFSGKILEAGKEKGKVAALELYNSGQGRELNNIIHYYIQQLQGDEFNSLQIDEQKNASRIKRINAYLFGLLMVILLLIFIVVQKARMDTVKRRKAEHDLQDFNKQLQEQVRIKAAELTGLFERITDGFIALDKNYCFTYVNKRAGELTNRDPESFIGKNIWDEFGHNISPAFRKAIYQAMNDQVYVNFEEYSGPYDRWFEDHLYPSPDGVSIFYRDISERKRAEEAIRKSEERYRALIEQASDAIMITDNKGNFLDVNTSFCNQFGYTKEELMGLNVSKVIEAAQLRSDPVRFDLLMAGQTISRERRMIRKDGTLVEVEANIKMLPDGRMLAIARDITERKRISEEKERVRYLLNERIKELTTLYRAGQILQEENKSVQAILQEIVLIIPGGWQYAETTAAKISLGNLEFATPNFKNGPQRQRAEFVTIDEVTGVIEVVYLEERPPESEGPFLMEERNLINMLGEMLRMYFTRKRAAELILKEKNLSDSIINSLPGIFYLRSLVDGKCLRWNENFEKATGASKEEIANSGLYDYISVEDVPKAKEAVERAVREGIVAVELKTLSQFNNVTYYITGIPINYQNQSCLMGTGIDISSLKRAEAELRISEQKYKLLFENNPLPIIVFSKKDFIVLEINASAITHYGYTRDEFLQMNVKDLRPPEDLLKFEEKFKETIATGGYLGIWRHVKKTGEMIDVEVSGHEIIYRDTPARLVLCNDVTEKLKAEENLKRSYEEIRQLASNIEKIREQEKIKIAREIHDELGQQLTGLKMDISWLSKKLKPDEKILQDKVREVMQLLDETVKSVRRIASELRPGMLDDLGLVAAMEWQSEEFEKRSGIKVEFAHSLANDNLPPNLSTGLFRIYQESLTNVARHAQAHNVTSSLYQIDGEVVLQISDDGKGFDAREMATKRTLGLLGMKERTMMMGGKYEIISNPGNGTTVVVSVPVTVENAERVGINKNGI